MFKHANTFFPGDVVIDASQNSKVAQPVQGKVISADPDSGKVKVAWVGGHEDWVEAERLVKQGG
jgi:hypothetical protein